MIVRIKLFYEFSLTKAIFDTYQTSCPSQQNLYFLFLSNALDDTVPLSTFLMSYKSNPTDKHFHAGISLLSFSFSCFRFEKNMAGLEKSADVPSTYFEN